MRTRQGLAERYVEAYGRYSWPVDSIDDPRLAPFHLLTSEGSTHTDRDHVWHMETLAAICRQGEALLLATPYRVIDVTNGDDVAATPESGDWSAEQAFWRPLKPDAIAVDRAGALETHGSSASWLPRGTSEAFVSELRDSAYLRPDYEPQAPVGLGIWFSAQAYLARPRSSW